VELDAAALDGVEVGYAELIGAEEAGEVGAEELEAAALDGVEVG